jgi:glucosamine 6-phosphate synthetase-like amidotransferase/phosphosugar isomerase protein
MNKKDYSNTIDLQIRDLEQLVDVQVAGCFKEGKREALLSVETAAGLKRVVISGCGDSFSAGGAMAEAFRKLSGIRALHVPDPMEFTRFYTDFDLTKGHEPQQTLVIAISASGGGDRIAEILDRGNDKGCHSILITNNPESKNCGHAKATYWVETPAGCNSPGLRSYFASMIALLGLACHIGKANGHIDQAEEDKLVSEVKTYVHDFMKEFERIDDQMFEQAVRFKDFKKIDLVADGPDYFSALFVEQKFIECGGVQATHTNAEEWVHISMMTREPEHIGTVFMIVHDSPSFGRIRDTSWGSCKLSRPTLVVTDAPRSEFADEDEADFCLIPKAPHYYLAPLMDFIPGSLIAAYQAAVNDKWFFNNHYDFRKQEWHRD